MGRIMAMDRISGTVMGTTEAGVAIGTTEGTEEATGIGGTKKSGKIPPRKRKRSNLSSDLFRKGTEFTVPLR